jgi:response regulator of citrate/malate metabolism
MPAVNQTEVDSLVAKYRETKGVTLEQFLTGLSPELSNAVLNTLKAQGAELADKSLGGKNLQAKFANQIRH